MVHFSLKTEYQRTVHDMLLRSAYGVIKRFCLYLKPLAQKTAAKVSEVQVYQAIRLQSI